jgi:hypothetical protein
MSVLFNPDLLSVICGPYTLTTGRDYKSIIGVCSLWNKTLKSYARERTYRHVLSTIIRENRDKVNVVNSQYRTLPFVLEIDLLDIEQIRHLYQHPINKHINRDFIVTYADKLNWKVASSQSYMTMPLIREFQHKLNWIMLGLNPNLTREFIVEHIDKLHFSNLCKHANLDIELIMQYKSKLLNCKNLALNPNLTSTFIRENWMHFNRKLLSQNLCVTEDAFNINSDGKAPAIQWDARKFQLTEKELIEHHIDGPYDRCYNTSFEFASSKGGDVMNLLLHPKVTKEFIARHASQYWKEILTAQKSAITIEIADEFINDIFTTRY